MFWSQAASGTRWKARYGDVAFPVYNVIIADVADDYTDAGDDYFQLVLMTIMLMKLTIMLMQLTIILILIILNENYSYW